MRGLRLRSQEIVRRLDGRLSLFAARLRSDSRGQVLPVREKSVMCCSRARRFQEVLNSAHEIGGVIVLLRSLEVRFDLWTSLL